jgi:hypothetical protein
MAEIIAQAERTGLGPTANAPVTAHGGESSPCV